MLKFKNICCYFILFLCLQTFITAQNSNRYYYYKGKKVNLCIDSTSFGVITKDTAQIKSIVDSMYSSSCDVFVPVFDKGGPLFFSIIQSNNQFEFFQNIDSVKSLIP